MQSRLNLGNKPSCINLLRSLQAPREGLPQGFELGKASMPYGYNVFRRIHRCGDALCAHRKRILGYVSTRASQREMDSTLTALTVKKCLRPSCFQDAARAYFACATARLNSLLILPNVGGEAVVVGRSRRHGFSFPQGHLGFEPDSTDDLITLTSRPAIAILTPINLALRS